MPIYLLSLLEPVSAELPGWQSSVYHAVVRADSPEAARDLLATPPEVDRELLTLFGEDFFGNWGEEGREVWLDPAKTSCVELETGGTPAVIATERSPRWQRLPEGGRGGLTADRPTRRGGRRRRGPGPDRAPRADANGTSETAQ